MSVSDVNIRQCLKLFVIEIVILVVNAHRRHTDAVSCAERNVGILKDPRLVRRRTENTRRLQINIRLLLALADGGAGKDRLKILLHIAMCKPQIDQHRIGG